MQSQDPGSDVGRRPNLSIPDDGPLKYRLLGSAAKVYPGEATWASVNRHAKRTPFPGLSAFNRDPGP